jgi:hypothetical protein
MVDALATRAEEGRGYAAISSGESLTDRSGDLRMGQPPTVMGRTTFMWGQVGELKHLSTPRKRNNSRSSGERTGISLNLIHVIAYRRCVWGVESHTRSAVAALSSKKSRM